MSEADEKSGFVVPIPTDGSGDNIEALRDEVAKGIESPLGPIQLSVFAMEFWRTCAEATTLGDDDRKALQEALVDITKYVTDRLAKVPLPKGTDTSVIGDGQTPVFIPYMTVVAMSMLSDVFAVAMPQQTVPERLALMCETVRAYALSGTAGYFKREFPGVDPAKFATTTALRMIVNPVPLALSARLAQQKRADTDEARLRGVSFEQLMKERIDRVAAGGKLPGEPD